MINQKINKKMDTIKSKIFVIKRLVNINRSIENEEILAARSKSFKFETQLIILIFSKILSDNYCVIIIVLIFFQYLDFNNFKN